MNPTPPPVGGDSRRRAWAPFLAELKSTASQATWGVWALCVLLLIAILVALGVALIDQIS